MSEGSLGRYGFDSFEEGLDTTRMIVRADIEELCDMLRKYLSVIIVSQLPYGSYTYHVGDCTIWMGKNPNPKISEDEIYIRIVNKDKHKRENAIALLNQFLS